jgi:hypothetical protein
VTMSPPIYAFANTELSAEKSRRSKRACRGTGSEVLRNVALPIHAVINAVALLMSANTLWCSVVNLNNIEGSGKLSVYMMQELQLAYDYGGKGSEGLSYTSQLCVLVGSTMDKSEKVICKLLAL